MTDPVPMMRADVELSPRPITRATAAALCELLGVDPAKVTRVVVTPGFVQITECVLVPAEVQAR